MRRTARLPGLAFALVPLFSGYAASANEPLEIVIPGDPIPEWEISGSNTARAEHYSIGGDPAASPFSSLGWQLFDELDIRFKRDYSPYNAIEGQFSGVLNDSDYRSGFKGLVPERGSITWRNGEVATPFKATAGDIFAFFSQRTINTSLKGLNIELQPLNGWFGADHSFQALAGTRMQTYRDDEQFDDQQHIGASWLMHWPDTALTFNASHARLGEDVTASGETIGQTVVSAAMTRTLTPSEEHRVVIDAELGYAFGERDAAAGAFNDEGFGVYAEARGDYGANFYRGKFERYEAAYAPSGASIAGDRQTTEAEVGRRFDNGLTARLRAQDIRDNIDEGVRRTTQVLGANVSGALPPEFGLEGASGSLDAFVQNTESADGVTDTRNAVVNLNLTLPVGPTWTATAGLLYDKTDDFVGVGDSITRQAQLGLARSFSIYGADGSFNMGFVARGQTDAGGSDFDFGPNASMSLRKGGHSLNLSANLLSQRPAAPGADLRNTRVAADWRYVNGPHVLGLEASYNGRDPSGAQDTDAYKVGFFYTLNFQKTPASRRAEEAEPRIETAARAPQITLEDALKKSAGFTDAFRLEELTLGGPIDDAYLLAEDSGLVGGVPFGPAMVFEERYLEAIFARQRIALVSAPDGQTLERAAVLISTDRSRGAAALEEQFTRVRTELIRLYGTPQTFEEGDFGQDAFAAITDGRLIRLAEWRAPGGTLRLGMPQRNDGVVRIEIQYARSFPPPRDTRWSVEAVR